MAKLLECTMLVEGEGATISINFDNVEMLETSDQHGRNGTKITFSSGRYIHVKQTTKVLNELVNAMPT